MQRESIGGIENRVLYLAVASLSILLMFLGLVTPVVTGAGETALLVQEGATVVGSGTWASLYLLTCSGVLIGWMWWSKECPLWARTVLSVPGGVVLLIAAMQGVAVSDLIGSLAIFGSDVGLGPGYWLLGAGGALLFLSSGIASLADVLGDYSVSVTRREGGESSD